MEPGITAQGHPRANYRRAIERGNLLVAETTLRELGRPTLGELLELTILIAARRIEAAQLDRSGAADLPRPSARSRQASS